MIQCHVHTPGDALADHAGWTATKTTGLGGLPARVYHDPRFGQPNPRQGWPHTLPKLQLTSLSGCDPKCHAARPGRRRPSPAGERSRS